MNNKLFLSFLSSLKTPENSSLLESVILGFKALTESPDKLQIPSENLDLHFEDYDARPFIFVPSKNLLFVDTSNHPNNEDGIGLRHEQLMMKLGGHEGSFDWDNPVFAEKMKRLGLSNDGTSISGRLWTYNKVISFWKYPSESTFKKIISKLKENGFSINSSWRVEVYPRDKYETVVIPIDEYKGQYVEKVSKPQSDKVDRELNEQLHRHLVNPIDKKKSPTDSLSDKKVETGGKTMAEYNNEKNRYRGEST